MTPDLITSEMEEKAARAIGDIKGCDLPNCGLCADLASAALEAALPDIIEVCAKTAEGKFEGESLYIEGRDDAAAAIRSLSPPTTKEREDGTS